MSCTNVRCSFEVLRFPIGQGLTTDNYSLIQINALQERLEGKHYSALGAVSHGAEAKEEARAAATEQARVDLSAMSDERKKSDHELEQQLSALKLLEAKL